jgi:hypothetical protein
MIAEFAPRRPEEAIAGTALAKRLEGKLGANKVTARLAEYRQAVTEWDEDGFDRDPGLLVWRGKDGRGGYWRACACRMEIEPCGQCEGCRSEKGCGAPTMLRLVSDPQCSEGHQYSGATTS